MKSYACNKKHTVVGPSCSLIDNLCSLSALSYVTGVQILWIWTLALRSKPKKMHHGWESVGEVRIFNMVPGDFFIGSQV